MRVHNETTPNLNQIILSILMFRTGIAIIPITLNELQHHNIEREYGLFFFIVSGYFILESGYFIINIFRKKK